MKATSSLPVLLGPVFLLPSMAHAAILTSAGTTIVSSVNLTEAGTSDWAAWHRGNNDEVASAAPTYRMDGGIATISAITTTNPSAITGPPAYKNLVRGTNSSTHYPANVFSWTNAVSDAAAPAYVSGIFHATTQQAVHGVQFSITNLAALTDGQFYRIHVYATSYNGSSTLTLTSGALTATQDGPVKGNSAGSKTTNLFAFDYNPDSASDSLLVTLLSNGTGSSAHGPLQAVSISIVPEPASPFLALTGAAALLFRRKKSHA